jgi:hypothetical protein
MGMILLSSAGDDAAACGLQFDEMENTGYDQQDAHYHAYPCFAD